MDAPGLKKKVTAEQLFEYLNGFKAPRKSENLPPGFEVKRGLSFGSLSLYQSLYEAMHLEAQEMYFAFDSLLSEPDVLGQRPQKLWHSVMWPVPFPDEWPTNNQAMFPQHWLYGFALFRKNQSVAAQQVYLRRLLYGWFHGIPMVRKKGLKQIVIDLISHTSVILQFTELLELWRAAGTP